ncbi:MAG: 4Fe-4S ferredoxin [Deltaproteobacteria bacterium]|nr:4Fe-4S ferredoxin [Deltaproteobacteria bacterium]
MKTMRKIIEIDEELCDGCGQCIISCAEGALALVDGKAKTISDNLCDGLGACIGECPTGALKIVEREAVEFDEKAVEKHLASGQPGQKKEEDNPPPTLACGCPSAQVKTFMDTGVKPVGAQPAGKQASALRQWPLQIRLVPANAPFLKDADLLVLADCAAVAYPNLHSDLLSGRIVMMGCPKFDDTELYIERFNQIFSTAGVKSITVAYMEVPCCAGLPYIVKKGLEKSAADIPLREIIISGTGAVMEDTGIK